MKSSVLKLTLFALFGILLLSCKKTEPQPVQYAAVDLNISYAVDGVPLVYDSLMYTNAAGNHYSVNKLEYYISNVAFMAGDRKLWESDEVFYMNAAMPETHVISFEKLPYGRFSGMTFLIGLDAEMNVTGSLPATTENLNMAWPDAMGGGYHFMKFEGHFDDNGINGFAMHLGKNPNLVEVKIDQFFDVNPGSQVISLEMNLNEWFTNPHIYDFLVDGNYSMSDMPAMQKLSANGTDVFKIK